MALTLTEGNKYSRTELQKGIIDYLVKDSPILQRLQFKTILGNSVTFNYLATRSTANWYQVGDTWVEDTPVLGQDTAALSILGGDADVDNFIAKTRSNINDVKAEVIQDKVVAVREEFIDKFYYGSGTAPEMKGMHGFMTSTTYNTVHAGATTGSDLSMAKLDEAMDLLRGFSPQIILMTRQLRRKIKVYLDSIGDKFPAERDQWGLMPRVYNGVPIYTDDQLSSVETAASGAYTAKTGSDCSSIFILHFAPQACCGIQGPDGVETIPLGDLETKDATRTRIRWYCGLMFQNLRSCAKVDGIHDAGTVVA